MSLRRDRELMRQRLAAIGRELDAILSSARDPSSAARAELSVRAGWRLADKVSRLADELKAIKPGQTQPAPPDQELVVREGNASPVEWMQARALIKPNHFMAGARLYNTFFAMPATQHEQETRRPLTAEQIRAQIEFKFVWKRCEDEEKTIAWALILRQPLLNDDKPLSPTVLGRRFSTINDDRFNRGYAFGMLRNTLVRLASAYELLDAYKAQQRKLT